MRDHYKQKYEWLLFNTKRAIFHLLFFYELMCFIQEKQFELDFIVLVFTDYNKQSAGIWEGGLWCLTPLSTVALSWRSVLLVEETGGPGENHRPEASHWQTLSHNTIMIMLYRVYLAMSWICRYMCHWTRTHMLYNEKNCGWQIMAKNYNLNSWLCWLLSSHDS
jgi:hypothetical protein